MRTSEPSLSAETIAPAAPADLVEVAAHQPDQHLLGDAGQGADPHARLAGRLAGGGVGERLDRRRQDHVGGGHRGGDVRAAARRRRNRARTSPPASRRRRRPAPRSASARRSLRSPGLQTTSTSSPGGDAHALPHHRPHRLVELRAHGQHLSFKPGLSRRRGGAAIAQTSNQTSPTRSDPKAMNGGSHPCGCAIASVATTNASPTSRNADQHRPHRRPSRFRSATRASRHRHKDRSPPQPPSTPPHRYHAHPRRSSSAG